VFWSTNAKKPLYKSAYRGRTKLRSSRIRVSFEYDDKLLAS
ncbi:hypothetical protein D018_2999B, partial [Vibrio parahaemolyticus VP2007-007]